MSTDSTDSTDAAGDDFAALLARVRQGDERAASELVARYEKTVLRSVQRRLSRVMRGAIDSIDVLQSVHRSLLIGIKNERFQLTTPQQLIGLAVVMVQRKVARQWRKLKRLPTSTRRRSDTHDTPIEEVASDTPTPSEVAAADEVLEQLLSELDPLDQQLVRLKLDGHSSAQTAKVLGRDPAFVRMRWTRLRQKLRARGFGD